VAGADTIIYVRGYFDFHAWGQQSGDQYYNVQNAGSAANKTWLRIIGCGSNGLPVAPWGEYVWFDSNGDSIADLFEINTPSGANIHFYGIRVGVSMTNGCGFFITAWNSNILIESCYLDGLYDAVNDDGGGGNKLSFLNCYMADGGNLVKTNDSTDSKHIIINCFLEPMETKADEAIRVDAEADAAIFIAGCVFVGGARGIIIESSNAFVMAMNNVFYEQTSSGLYLTDGAKGNLVNNIFYSTQTGFVIIDSTGLGVVLLEDYNATNKASGLIGAHSLHNIPDPFVDKTNHDFRLKPGTSLLNKGLPAISGQFTINKLGCSTIGAWQQKQFFISKSRIANPGRFSIFR
jgi:hypothetical protein